MRFIRAIDRRLKAQSDGYAQISLKIHMFFNYVKNSWVFREIELLRHLNP